MNMGVKLSDNRPCAIVLPRGISALARSWSTWIHCLSQVASANLLMRSCVTSIQSLTPTSVPTAAFSSSNPLNIRMTPRLAFLKLHFRNLVRNREFGLSHRQHLGDGDAGRRLLQRCSAAGKGDDRHIRDD